MLKLLFIADPLESFKVYKDTTLAMMNKAFQAGHQIFFAHENSLQYSQSGVVANCVMLEIDLTRNPWYLVTKSQVMPLKDFDAVLMRQDPPFNVEYLANTWILSAAEKEGAKVFNTPSSLREHSEKISILEFSEFIAPTIVSRSTKEIKAFHQEHKDIVVKPLDGMGGMGVFRVGPDGLNLGSIIETLGEYGKRSLMAQKYLPEIVDGDKRLLLIGGKAVPYVLARVPQKGDIRGNLAAGGVGEARPLTNREKEIAEKIGPVLIKRGLFLVGLDIIGSNLTEINVTSPTGFVEISKQTDFDVAQFWLDQLVLFLKKTSWPE
jgi:glutathione synthase